MQSLFFNESQDVLINKIMIVRIYCSFVNLPYLSRVLLEKKAQGNKDLKRLQPRDKRSY